MSSVDQAASADLLTAGQGRFATGLLVRIFVGVALLSAFGTFLALAGLTPIAPTEGVVIGLVAVNVIAVVILSGIIGVQVWRIFQARRRGRAGAKLHVSIIGLFSVIAAVPAILVAVMATVTFDRALDRVFTSRTRSVIESSMSVAQAYVREHAEGVTNALGAMALDVVRAKPLFDQDREQFHRFFTAQAGLRGLAAALILSGDRSVIEQAELKPDSNFVMPTAEELASVTDTQIQIRVFLDDNYAAAVLKLRGFDNAYIYAARMLDPRVVAQLRTTQASIGEYAALEERRVGVQIAFALMYTVIALIVLLSAVLIGLNFTNRL